MALHRLLILPLAALPLLGTDLFAQDARQYRAWDRNSDGVITRAEWRGPVQEFRERDWNADGVLSGREVWNDVSPADDRWTAREFASLDRNGNGRLSRGEWRGQRAGFQRADRNGDNQISRDEFVNATGTAQTESAGDFDALDLDFNERIERDEWTGTRPAFNRLDTNRDGRLTRRELAADDVARTSWATNDADARTVVIDPRQPWTHTGIAVSAGDLVTYRATGTIELSSGGNDRATAQGALSGRTAKNSARPDVRAGSLLLRIGNGPIAVLGEGGSFRAQQSGQLSLGVNDDHFADNSGEYRVSLTISPQ